MMRDSNLDILRERLSRPSALTLSITGEYDGRIVNAVLEEGAEFGVQDTAEFVLRNILHCSSSQGRRNRLPPPSQKRINIPGTQPFVCETITPQEPSEPSADTEKPWMAGELGICNSANTT